MKRPQVRGQALVADGRGRSGDKTKHLWGPPTGSINRTTGSTAQFGSQPGVAVGSLESDRCGKPGFWYALLQLELEPLPYTPTSVSGVNGMDRLGELPPQEAVVQGRT